MHWSMLTSRNVCAAYSGGELGGGGVVLRRFVVVPKDGRDLRHELGDVVQVGVVEEDVLARGDIALGAVRRDPIAEEDPGGGAPGVEQAVVVRVVRVCVSNDAC